MDYTNDNDKKMNTEKTTPVISKNRDANNILENAKNSLNNLKDHTSTFDNENTSLENAIKNKPFSFKEVNNMSSTPTLSSTNNELPSKRILEPNKDISPLNQAYIQKKQELFKSFNLDQPIDNNKQVYTPSNSERILKNKINDDSEIKIVSLKAALSKKKRY